MFALGLLLVLLGAILVAAEAHVPSHGALGAGAVASLAVGVALLVSAAGSAVLVAVFAGLLVAGVGSATLWQVVRKALGTRRLREPGGRHEKTFLILVSAGNDLDDAMADGMFDARVDKPASRKDLMAALARATRG